MHGWAVAVTPRQPHAQARRAPARDAEQDGWVTVTLASGATPTTPAFQDGRFEGPARQVQRRCTCRGNVFFPMFPDQKRWRSRSIRGRIPDALENIEIGTFLFSGLNRRQGAHAHGIPFTYLQPGPGRSAARPRPGTGDRPGRSAAASRTLSGVPATRRSAPPGSGSRGSGALPRLRPGAAVDEVAPRRVVVC